ncbi:CLUMA_CG018474, isoform A [Clunio marinus]|uniref:CLUMA_CG018474, isoform A n=1 Tax=Clunio marinus TaxID=568069 RepID=A0A1J1J1X0_9DIPT|nr:CLUMA_CG018474, isoform A [Clunio marinus]
MNLKIILINLLCVLITFTSSNELEGEKLLSRQKRKLLFPQFTVLQISMCFVSQVSYIPSHKVAVNNGFQINYRLPYILSEFYSPIFWARSFANQSSNLLLNFVERMAADENNDNDEDSNEDEMEEELIDGDDIESDDEESSDEITTVEKRRRRRKRDSNENGDISAGLFYSGIRNSMAFAGYHEDCLIKCVCELAKHPLEHDHDNLINEVTHFILTPSRHQSFDSKFETEEKKIFEEAEKLGSSGADCDKLYGNCKVSPLDIISNFINHSN